MYKTTVSVDGMMCGHCEAHVNDAVRKDFQVKKVSSSHAKKETVIISDEKLCEEDVKNCINATGYEVLGIKQEPYEEKKGLFGLFKK